jgi:hypothetical protein
VDLVNRHIVADGQRIPLQPAPFGFYVALVSRVLRGLEPLHAPFRDEHDEEWAQTVRQDLFHVFGLMELPDTLDQLLHDRSSGQLVSPLVSRLRGQLRKALAPERIGLYFHDGDTHRNKRYQVPLPAASITLLRALNGAAHESVSHQSRRARGQPREAQLCKLAKASPTDAVRHTPRRISTTTKSQEP